MKRKHKAELFFILFFFFFWFDFLFIIFLIFWLVYLYLDLFPCNIPIVIYSYVPYELAGNLLHTLLLPQTTL